MAIVTVERVLARTPALAVPLPLIHAYDVERARRCTFGCATRTVPKSPPETTGIARRPAFTGFREGCGGMPRTPVLAAAVISCVYGIFYGKPSGPRPPSCADGPPGRRSSASPPPRRYARTLPGEVVTT
ncbi:hypothetical protein GCM10009850_048110 [Nonomuraea monospora]|uniref:Uncharacterized protein n=1 Tax=Nonomuraea monospora TaxID=568818 RepID=A0ABN3CJZ4_9ACTN